MGLPQLFLLWELSDQRIAEAWFEEKTRFSGRLSMPGGKFPGHAENLLLCEWRKTLLPTHDALSPHPHVIICTSLILSMDCAVFIVSQCQINDY